MIRVVIDTSVLVSAIISRSGPNAQVIDGVIAGELRHYVTSAVVEEYHRVFEYEHLRGLDRRIVATAVKVKSGGRLKISAHEDDNRIYECALAAKADYIITENTKHFKEPYKTTRIITARQLIRILD